MSKKTRFDDLDKSDIKYITDLYGSKEPRKWVQEQIALRYNVKVRAVRTWAKKLDIVNAPTADYVNAQLKVLSNKKYYLVTWGQCSTPVHERFFSNMEAYAAHLDAEISVIAGRYRNPTSIFPDKDKEIWVPRIKPYLDASRHDVHHHMQILSDIKISPTAKMPLTSLEGMSSQKSCVVGHPRVQLKVIPALNGYIPKMMLTTGACTVPNYTDSKAGKIGEFHHTLGFVIIEVDGDEFHTRQVTADDNGDFTDLMMRVKKGKIQLAEQPLAFIFGDIHVGDHDPILIGETLNLCSILKPKNVILHDIFNGHSVNHHEMKNPFKRYENLQENRSSLKVEIDEMIDFLGDMTQDIPSAKIHVVRSNHDDFIDRYLINSDWKKDVANGLEYMEYGILLLKGEAPKGIIPYLINKRFPKINTLDIDESLRIDDWEFGVHGHEGANGSRGNPNQYKRLSTKMVTAHTHTPSRIDGVVTVGTSTKLRVGYNTGASSWMQSHGILHADGKVQQIHAINHKFTTLL